LQIRDLKATEKPNVGKESDYDCPKQRYLLRPPVQHVALEGEDMMMLD